MRYLDPKQMERIPDSTSRYDPDTDWITILGIQPHLPSSSHDRAMGEPCPSCGFKSSEPIVRKRAIVQDGVTIANARRGLVLCTDCCQASLDSRVSYPGLPVGTTIDKDYKTDADEAAERAATEDLATPTRYEGGGMQRRVLTRREKREAKQAEKRERKGSGE